MKCPVCGREVKFMAYADYKDKLSENHSNLLKYENQTILVNCLNFTLTRLIK